MSINSMEHDMRAHSASLLEAQEELERTCDLTKAIQLISDDPIVRTITDRIKMSVDSILVKIFVCRSEIEVLTEKLLDKIPETVKRGMTPNEKNTTPIPTPNRYDGKFGVTEPRRNDVEGATCVG